MTISATPSRVTYATDNVTTVFPVPIQAYNASDFLVYLTNTTTGVASQLALNSNYTLAPSGTLAPPAWTLTAVDGGVPDPFGTGSTLLIIRNPVQQQQTQFVQGQAFPSLAVQTAFDSAVEMIQRLQDELNRSIRAPDGDAAATMLLPPAVQRANLAPAFDANGNLVLTGIPTTAFTQANFNGFLANAQIFAQTPAEFSANVTPVNYFYPPGHVDRYLTNASPGTTPMAAGFQRSINQARAGGADVVWGETAPYVLEAPLDCTNSNYGLTFRQVVPMGTNLGPPVGSFQLGALWVQHNQYTVFDCAGCQPVSFYDLSLSTSTVAGTYPQTCFYLARTALNNGANARFHNTCVLGNFSVAILYNYASENGVYSDNNWDNYAPDANACCVVVTTSNYFKTSQNYISSSFATVLTGTQSTLSHEFRGGSYLMENASGTSDIFYLEGGVARCRLLEFWVDCSNKNGSTNGRSIVYNDTSNANAPAVHTAANWTEIRGVHVETGVTQPSFGVAINAGGGTANAWSITDSYFHSVTNDIFVDSSVTVNGWRIQNLQTFSGLPGFSAAGAVTQCWLDLSVVMLIGTSTRNIYRNSVGNLTRSSHTGDILIDTGTGALTTDVSIGMNGASPPGQFTGWGTPVGGAVISNYNITDAGGANSNTNKAVAQIITMLKALGLGAA